MKIQQHPRMKDVLVGDEVLCYGSHLYARVEEVFPHAVCVRLVRVRSTWHGTHLESCPQLWRADEIENLSICQYCGGRDDTQSEPLAGIPFRTCALCASIQPTQASGVLNDHVSH